MRRDPNAAFAGLTKVTAGVHSSMAPAALPPNQLAWATNIDCRTDFLRPRPGWLGRPLTFLGNDGQESATVQHNFEEHIFQGAAVFERFGQIVCMIGGHLFAINPSTWSVIDVSTTDLNPSNRYRGWFCEAEDWMIVQDGVSIPWIYDGASTKRSDTLGAGGRVQVPIGTAMCYAQGRLHVAYATGRAFVVGDIVGGDSGTAPYGFKDSVLCFTENDVINGGGSFAIPINAGPLTAFRPIAQIDTAMGQGPTQVFTQNAVFSLNLPTDRTTWQTVNFPIGTVSNVANGATSDRCTPNVNGDIWFRAPDGVRAFMVARRDFQAAWVNAPLSQEVSRSIDGDDENLLGYASAAYFDNRLLMTTRPYRSWGHGIVHQGLVQLDFQPVATLSERNPIPTWLGNATGAQVLQIVSGSINGVQRCFIFALSSVNRIEVWEVTKRNTADSNGPTSVPIEWSFETAAFAFALPGASNGTQLPGRELWSLDGGRLFVDEIEGPVSFALQWKPDQDPCWHDWHSWNVCALNETCGSGTDCLAVPPNLRPQYRQYFNLPAPRDDCDTVVGKPPHILREAQVRATITGRCRVKMIELIAHAQEEDVTKLCAPSEECAAASCCAPDDFSYVLPDVPEGGTPGSSSSSTTTTTAPPEPTGACRLGDDCWTCTEAECVTAGGTYQGDGTSCEDPPVVKTGACWVGRECSIMTEADCIAAGGSYQGDDTDCGTPPIPSTPEWPVPTPYDCEGRALFGPIAVQDPLYPNDGSKYRYVGIAPGAVDPNTYLSSWGTAGCLEAWCAEVWAQFLATGTPFSQARFIWYNNTLTGLNWMGSQVFPDQLGGYFQVIDLDWYVALEYCPETLT